MEPQEQVRKKRCRKCRAEAPAGARDCPRCGYPFLAHFDRPRAEVPRLGKYVMRSALAERGQPPGQDVSVAALASVILPGAGQFYNGQTVKGVLVVLALALLLGLAFVNRVAALVLLPLLWTASVADAALVAGRLIRREPVGPWRWF